jgi:hypothetical protein
MDQDTIQKIAQETAYHLSHYSWQLLAVQSVLTVVAFASGVWFGEYRKTRVSTAKREDPRPLKSETVEEPLGLENWRKREWAQLRRTKLELLLSKVHDCEHYVGRSTASQATRAQERDPMSELEIIKTLYFPELKVEVDDFLRRCCGESKVAIDTTTTEFKTARDRLDAAARTLTSEIMGVDDAPHPPAVPPPTGEIAPVST